MRRRGVSCGLPVVGSRQPGWRPTPGLSSSFAEMPRCRSVALPAVSYQAAVWSEPSGVQPLWEAAPAGHVPMSEYVSDIDQLRPMALRCCRRCQAACSKSWHQNSCPAFRRCPFNEFIDKGITGVTATTELVGKAQLSANSTLLGVGTALELPVRVHLENTFLGSGCYIGSASKPVTVDFTTGTTSPPAPNKPIVGAPGEVSFGSEGVLEIAKNSLVNNSFAAPKAVVGSSRSLSTTLSMLSSNFLPARATTRRSLTAARKSPRREAVREH